MITTEQETAIRDVLAAMPTLAVGIGTAEQACSIAAVNLALTGTLTDDVPECMSSVIGRWIISVQDRMPAAIRDSTAWRELLVLSAGTGGANESERIALVLDWMWDALALMQPRADAQGYGEAWATMLCERTSESAYAAAYASGVASAYTAAYSAKAAAEYAAAYAPEAAYAYADKVVAESAYAAAYASEAVSEYTAAYSAKAAAEYAAEAAYAYADKAVAESAYAAACASESASAGKSAAAVSVAASEAAYAAKAVAASEAAYAAAWATIDPVGLLRRLIAVTDARALEVQS